MQTIVVHREKIHETLAAAGSALPVSFAVGNLAASDPGPVVYISSDPSLGKLLITIQNNSSAPLNLTPATTLDISMFPLLLPADIAKMKLVTTAWTGQPSAKGWEISPASNILFSDPLTIEFDNVLASQKEAGTGFFVFSYAGFNGTSDDTVKVTMQRLHPPTALPLDLSIDLGPRSEYGEMGGSSTGSVYQTTWTPPVGSTGIANRVLPRIVNTNFTASVPIGGGSKIQISFLSGDAQNCLCSDQQLLAAQVSVTQSDPGSSWTITLDTSDASPIWTITPNQSNQSFLNAAGGILELQFANLITQLPVGSTPLFVHHSGIPGYNDGYTIVLLTKGSPVPSVVSFTAATAGGTLVAPDSAVAYNAPLTLSWNVFAAEQCSLNGQNLPPVGTSVVNPLDPATVYNLSPIVNNQPYGIVPLQFAIAPPTALLTIQGSGGPATLSWVCTSCDQVILTADGTAVGDNQPLSGSLAVSPVVTTPYEITCNQLHGPQGSASSSATLLEPPNIQTFQASISVWPLSHMGWHFGNWAWRLSVDWSTSNCVSCKIVVASIDYPDPPGTILAQGLSGSWNSGQFVGGFGGPPRSVGGFAIQIEAVAPGGLTGSITSFPTWTPWTQ